MSYEPLHEAAETFRGEAGEEHVQAAVSRGIAHTAPESAVLTRLAQLQLAAGNVAVVRLLTPPAAE